MLLSATVTVNSNGVEPGVVGVPLSVPSGLSVRPGGNVPAVTVQLSGEEPPAAVNVKLYGVPRTPAGGVCPGVITSGDASIWRLTGRVPVSAGFEESATMTVNVKKGSYTYICSVKYHAAQGMQGTLVVK